MIAVNGVSKNYGSVTAVDDLTFTVDRGEVVGFLGPNGAGKTTTMRMITGTLQPDEGEVLFDGAPITEDLTDAKRRVGYLPESNPLYDEMLVADYLQHVADLRGLSLEDTRVGIRSAVEETALGTVFYRPVGECSKGYRQRIGLAAAILHRPEVLILDEPTKGIDVRSKSAVHEFMGELVGEGMSIIMISSELPEILGMCDRVVVMYKGLIKEILDVKNASSEQIVKLASGES